MVGRGPKDLADNDQGYQDPTQLLLLAKNGDNQAFELLYELCYLPVFRYLFLRIRNKAQAEDLTQVVFVKVWNSLPNYEDKNAHPLSYFFTIARNSLIDHVRKEKNAPVADENVVAKASQELHDPYDHTKKRENEEFVAIALSALTEDQRQIIELKFLSELSNKEISVIIGKKEEAIRQLQLRAMRRLRDYFQNEDMI